MANYFSKLARMTGLPVGAGAFHTPAADRPGGFPHGGAPLHEEEGFPAEPPPVQGAQAEAGEEAPARPERIAAPGAALPGVAADRVPAANLLPDGDAAAPPGPARTPPADGWQAAAALEAGPAAGREPAARPGLPRTPPGDGRQAAAGLDSAMAMDGQVLRPDRAGPAAAPQHSPPTDPGWREAANRHEPSPSLAAAPAAQALAADAGQPVGRAGDQAADAKPARAVPPLPGAAADMPGAPDPQADLWREINAWISDRPGPDPAAVAWPEPRPAAARPPAGAEDFTLTIGNISIIVEEQPKPAAAPPPTPARGVAAPAASDGFFRLSRYYL